MIVNQLSKEEFDKLVRLEPDANLYHTSKYNSYLGKEMVYLGILKDEFYCAFASILVTKKSWFKKEATCEFGYLTNYYDFEELQNINVLLLNYLKSLKVSSFTFSPNIKYITKYGKNDLLIKQITSFGYKKINNHYIYSFKLDKDESLVLEDVFTVKENSDDELIENSLNINLKQLRSTFNDHLHVFSSFLNFDSSVFMDDPERLNKIKKELNGNNLLQCIIVLDYEGNLYLLDSFSRCSLLDSNKSLLNATVDFYNDKKEHYLFSDKPFSSLEKTELIGKFYIEL